MYSQLLILIYQNGLNNLVVFQKNLKNKMKINKWKNYEIKVFKNLNNLFKNIVKAIPVLNTNISSVPKSNNVQEVVKKKTFIERTMIGIKRGLTTPTLSKEMLEFQKNPLIRILRVIGGISCLSLLGHDHIKLQGLMLYVALFFTLLFYIYHVYILIHRYKHIKYLLKTGAMDYRNSPLDKYITLLGRMLLCAKGACDLATPIGTNLGLMIGVDEVLKASGRDAFFAPLLGAGLNKILPKTNLDQ
jgi:hypothetical protein